MQVTVVGIAGGTASGKSSVAHGAAQALGERCLLVQHDRYYHSCSEPEGFNFDHPEALDNDRLVDDLDCLVAGRATRLPRYDFATHSRIDTSEPVEPRPVVIVEGILILAVANLLERLHHRVFVEAPEPVRLKRRIRRDVAERGRTEADVIDQYARTVRPMHDRFVAPSRAHASLVLDGTRPLEDLVRRVVALLPPE